MKIINIGVKNRITKNAKREPYNVKIIASWAFPSFNISCPGKMDKKVSSSGAPRKTEGMKSINVWVVAIETINIARTVG